MFVVVGTMGVSRMTRDYNSAERLGFLHPVFFMRGAARLERERRQTKQKGDEQKAMQQPHEAQVSCRLDRID